MGCPVQPSEVVIVARESKDISCTPPRASSAFMVNSEIGAVLAVMRRNVRWGVQYMDDEDQLEHPLIKSFKEIRKKVFSWQCQWHAINPVVYLQPFLDIIQSDETSAPITGVALSSIYKFLTLEVVDLDTVNVADALHLIVDAVTSCRFEVTDPASEEVVLMKILQVLLACMKNKASVKLSNQHVCNIVNTCFQIVHQAISKGELLQRTARHTVHELIRCIFMHLPDAGNIEQEFSQEGRSSVADEVGMPDKDLLLTSKPQDNGYTGSKIESVGGALNLFTDMPEVKMDESTSEVGQGKTHIVHEPYGVPCMVEIFSFLCSLLNAVEYIGVGPRANSLTYDEDVPLFALGLINSAIELGGASLSHHPEILALVQNDLFHSLMQFGLSPSPLILSTVCSIVLILYNLMRVKLKLQLEAFISSVLMKIAVNKHGASYQQQEVAMETIVDLCRQPAFIHEMYANYDCDVSCSNIFEDLANLLSKSAFPVNSPLSAIHILALDGLMAMISSIVESVVDEVPVLEPDESIIEDHEPFWKVKCESFENPDFWVPFIHKMKHIKKKLMIGADHFNRDPRKGLQFLQGLYVLPDTLDPASVACFLRYTTGLDKNLVGDYLGNHDPFCVCVLQEFAKTFDFQEMNLDIALRVFLETFRLPGESQKIQRVVEAFAEQYYEQSPHVLANKDAALLLSYSLILLNTDQHNAQVKKKMTEEDFIRNNRQINGGNDLPQEYLSELYRSISENEIRMTAEQGAGSPVMTRDNWIGLIHKSRQTTPFIVCGSGARINNEMFAILSGPTVAALSVVLDLVEQDDVLLTSIDGFLDVAKIAGCYHLDDVLDGLLVSLSKFTTLLLPMSIEESILAFGEDTKARKATVAVFSIANTYGDYIRSGWRNILDCILSLHKLGLLPGRLTDDLDPISDTDSVRAPLVSPVVSTKTTLAPMQKSSSFIGRFSEFLYYDTEKPVPQPSEEQLEARNRAMETVKECHIENVFTESKFLQSESLLNLARALILAAGLSCKGNDNFVEDADAAILSLELLITVALNNRDRIMLLWQGVYEHIANIVQSSLMPITLVEKAVFGLIRICQRLLPYKEDLTDELLKSLQLILKLDARVADAYCEHITQEIMRLVKANVARIKSHMGWRTITSLLSITARHPDASDPGFETLEFIMVDGAHMLPANFVLCVNAARQFAESRVGDIARSLKSLDLMAGSAVCLVRWTHETREAVGEEAETAVQLYQDIGEMWLRLVQALRKVCTDAREEIRNHAVLMLQRCLTGLEGVYLQEEMWLQCFDLVIFVLVNDLLEIVHERSPKEYRNMEGTLVLSLKLLSKAFLHSLPSICRLMSFGKVWEGVLNSMELYTKVKLRGKRSEKIHELVPELLKNTLLVMKSSEILAPGDDDGVWQQTWLHVKRLAPSLQSEVFPVDEPEQAMEGTSVPEGNVLVP